MSLINHVPEQYRAGAEACAKTLANFNRTLVAAHVNLDGDALGAICATGFLLKSLGKEFALYCSSGVPGYLNFLPMPGRFYHSLSEIPFSPESAIYLDCNDVARLGSELAAHARNYPSINIDHHIGGRGLGSLVNYIESGAAATVQLVAYVVLACDIPLKGPVAECIALGLMTDTGGFCHGNTTTDVFSLCSLLSANGCRISDIREKLENSWSLERIHLWGDLLKKLALYFEKRIAFCHVSLEELNHYHCGVDDLEGLVDQFRKIRGVQVAVLLREEKPGLQKFSMRSYGDVDVRSMATVLGGGGHQNAAGGLIETSPEEAKMLLLEIIRQQLEKDGR